MDLALCGQLKYEGRIKEYDTIKCGSNVALENCSYYKYILKKYPNNQFWQDKMNANKCSDVLSGNLAETISEIYGTYSSLDKQRIEKESKYQRNKKIFFGGMVFITVIGIFLIKKK